VSVLFAALYPQISKILTPETNYVMTAGGSMPKALLASDLKFKTKDDGYVNLHPSSTNSNVSSFPFPFLIYQEKVKTSRLFLRETSAIPTISLILFSGSDWKIELHNGCFLFLLEENWIAIQAENVKVAESIKHMRKELMAILEKKIEDPLLNLLNHDQGRKIISTIILLISKV
jgi:ATP-dependent RNA helicase DHX57